MGIGLKQHCTSTCKCISDENVNNSCKNLSWRKIVDQTLLMQFRLTDIQIHTAHQFAIQSTSEQPLNFVESFKSSAWKKIRDTHYGLYNSKLEAASLWMVVVADLICFTTEKFDFNAWDSSWLGDPSSPPPNTATGDRQPLIFLVFKLHRIKGDCLLVVWPSGSDWYTADEVTFCTF